MLKICRLYVLNASILVFLSGCGIEQEASLPVVEKLTEGAASKIQEPPNIDKSQIDGSENKDELEKHLGGNEPEVCPPPWGEGLPSDPKPLVTEPEILAKIPDCFTNPDDRSKPRGGYMIYIDATVLNKCELMYVLDETGHIANLRAEYLSFPMWCGERRGTNCMTLHEYLVEGARQNIRNGYENPDDVKQAIEEDLARLLKHPGVSIDCVREAW